MTVQELIDLLSTLKDKDREVILMVENEMKNYGSNIHYFGIHNADQYGYNCIPYQIHLKRWDSSEMMKEYMMLKAIEEGKDPYEKETKEESKNVFLKALSKMFHT